MSVEIVAEQSVMKALYCIQVVEALLPLQTHYGQFCQVMAVSRPLLSTCISHAGLYALERMAFWDAGLRRVKC